MYPPCTTPSARQICRHRLVPLLIGLALLLTVSQSAAQDSRNVTLLSHMDLYERPNEEWSYSTVWSYVHSDGREYAVLAAVSGVSIVRLTDPAHPVEVGFINLRDSGWHETRQYRDHLYVVTEVFNGLPASCGLEVISMQDPDHPRKVPYNSNILWAHSLEIDTARGILYANGADGGLHIYSLANPDAPAEIGRYPYYAHDTHLRGTLGFASLIYNGTEHILDLSNPAAPTLIKEFPSPLGSTHSAWTTEDQGYLYVADETIGRSVTVYDIHDLRNPQIVWRHEAFPDEIAHHPRIKGTTAYIAHYTRGVRLWDVTNGGWPVEYGYYDTSEYLYGAGHGAWEVCPFFPSGIFAVSDMQTGLYVFRANPSHTIVRGTVRDPSSGAAIEGVTVRVSGTTLTTRSASDGRYAIAPDPGPFTLVFSAFGYDGTSKAFNQSAGVDRSYDLNLVKHPGTVRGVAVDAGTQTALPFAEVDLLGTSLHAVSDATGAYLFPIVPEGTYTVRCARPGYVTRAASATVARGRETLLNFSLSAAPYYDGFETDRGWVVGSKNDDATGGFWERGAPEEVCDCFRSEPYIIQPGADHSPGPGTLCWVTGASRRSFFPLGGQTTLTSPLLSVAGIQDPRIAFWRWYRNRVGFFPGDDPAVTQLSSDGGATWTTISSVYFPPVGWEYVEFRLRDFIPTGNTFMIRFIAADRSDFSEAETLIDDFALFSGTGGTGLPAASFAVVASKAVFGRVGPSPSRGAVRMSLSLPTAQRVTAQVFDVAGRLVATAQDGLLPSGPHTLEWNGRTGSGDTAPAGVYFLQVRQGGDVRREKFVVVR